MKKASEVVEGEMIRPTSYRENQPFAEVISIIKGEDHVIMIVKVPELGTVPVEFHNDEEMLLEYDVG